MPVQVQVANKEASILQAGDMDFQSGLQCTPPLAGCMCMWVQQREADRL